MRIAVARYAVQAPADFDAFARRQDALLGQAAAQGANIAVLPEYLSLELGATFEARTRGDLAASLAALQRHHDAWRQLFTGLARRHGVLVVAGTFLVDTGRGRYRNRAYVCTPDGGLAWQDKLQLTGFEKRAGVIESGDALRVFEHAGVRFGVAVCYDIEFPLPVRAQCEAGARLLLVPSCTDTTAGATRVRVGCLARALENRSFVGQAVTSGLAPWSPALDVNTGQAAVYAPMDAELPDDGVLAAGTGAASDTWVIASLDFAALDASRDRAQVANDRDWGGQHAPALSMAQVVAV